jgi:hypothetical protein
VHQKTTKVCKEIIFLAIIVYFFFVRPAILCEIVTSNTMLQASVPAVAEQLHREADNEKFNHFRE